ncbi:MAG: hypothetical protein K9G59_00540 [Caulobacter sp.]|nr:hypothetical protein [Caulobacter sp.]
MTKPAGSLRTEAERNLALLGYGLLGISIFFAGVTAVVAVGIAYALHDAATDELSRHFRFQVRIFWVGMLLIAAFAIMGIAGGLLFLREIIADHGHWQGVDLRREFVEQINEFRYSGLAFSLLAASGLSAVLGILWMFIAPTIGFIRLATSRRMGETAHP